MRNSIRSTDVNRRIPHTVTGYYFMRAIFYLLLAALPRRLQSSGVDCDCQWTTTRGGPSKYNGLVRCRAR